MTRISPRDDKGALAEAQQDKTHTGVSEEVIPYGKFVMVGSNTLSGTNYESNQGVKVFDGTTGQHILGIAKQSLEPGMDDDQYDANQPVEIGRSGIYLAEVDANSTGVSVGDTLAVMPSGDVMAESDLSSGSGEYAVTLENSEFVTSGAAGDIVVVELNMPCKQVETQLAA